MLWILTTPTSTVKAYTDTVKQVFTRMLKTHPPMVNIAHYTPMQLNLRHVFCFPLIIPYGKLAL